MTVYSDTIYWGIFLVLKDFELDGTLTYSQESKNTARNTLWVSLSWLQDSDCLSECEANPGWHPRTTEIRPAADIALTVHIVGVFLKTIK